MSEALERIINSRRMPALFIGTGISIRYLENYPSWLKLLENIAGQIGIDGEQLLAVINEIRNQNPQITKGKLYQLVGDRLESELNRKVAAGSIKLKAFFKPEEVKVLIKEQRNIFKALTAKQFSTYRIVDDDRTRQEIALFREAVKKVSCVFTTNYDVFLENSILETETKVYTSQNQYYFRDASGYGELYKIHGSISDPDNLVITSRDYKDFEDNLKLVAAKILNCLMDFPIIFLGYSFEDENIKNIFESFINSFPNELIKEISKYMIYVQHEKGQRELIEGERRFGGGKAITMTTIRTDNYAKIYEYINGLKPCATSVELRRYKSMFSKLVRSCAKGEDTIKTIGADSLDELKGVNIVVAFGSEENVNLASRALYGEVGKTKEELIRQCLFDEIESGDFFITEWFRHTSISGTEYLPVYYLLGKAAIKFENADSKFKKNYNTKEMILEKISVKNKIDSASISDLKTYCSSRIIKNEKGGKNYRNAIKEIVFQILINKIDKALIREYLKELYCEDNNLVKNSDFKKAVCYLDK